MIAFHELLHLDVPPGINDEGLPDPHPPRFRETERLQNPWLSDGWTWLGRHLPLENLRVLDCTGVVQTRLRLTETQRAWILEQTGVHVPKTIRLDEPALRTQAPLLWATILLARLE